LNHYSGNSGKQNTLKIGALMGVEVGERSIILNCDFGAEPYLVTIGTHWMISAKVQFVTHDAGIWVFRDTPATKFEPIVVHDNCVIGISSTILPDVEIGSHMSWELDLSLHVPYRRRLSMPAILRSTLSHMMNMRKIQIKGDGHRKFCQNERTVDSKIQAPAKPHWPSVVKE
jgi:hypothetical protein